jgi:hypothetical protein
LIAPAFAQGSTQADNNNANYQAQQQQYQNQLQQNQAQQQQYQDRTAAYEGLRVRYTGERAAYHRGIWPDRYTRWVIVERDAKLIGERVELLSGNRVGTVIDTAHAAGGNVEALLVRLDDDKIVWIDASDVRYNRADGIVMTDLEPSDLHHMRTNGCNSSVRAVRKARGFLSARFSLWNIEETLLNTDTCRSFRLCGPAAGGKWRQQKR